MNKDEFATIVYDTLAGNRQWEQLDPAKLGDKTQIEGNEISLEYEGITYVLTVNMTGEKS